MASIVTAAMKAQNHIDEGLKKVQAKPWAQPLGQTLKVTAKVVEGLGLVVPGAGAIGGALAFGANLLVLSPELSLKDLHKELEEIKELMLIIRGQGAKEALVKQQEELEQKIKNPPGEIRSDFDKVWEDMRVTHKQVGESYTAMAGEMSKMKDQLRKTFLVVTDIRFKVRKLRPIRI